MSVIYGGALDIGKVFTAFHLEGEYEALKNNGVQVKSGVNKLLFIKYGSTLKTVTLPGGSIDQAMKGELMPLSFSHLKGQLETAIEQALAMANTTPGSTPSTPKKKWTSSYGATPNPKPNFTPPPGASGPEPSQFATPTTLSFGHPSKYGEPDCTLYSALALYQKVPGTTAGSLYTVVAMGPGINMAARVQGQKVSIRVQGSNFQQYKPMFLANDFTVHESHASIHIDCETSVRVGRVIGAVIMGLGIFQSPLPDLKKLVA
jgi:hypothetical protein